MKISFDLDDTLIFTDTDNSYDIPDHCCFFCCNKDNLPVGTATAWFTEKYGFEQGMLSWVVISKEYQGRGLCRPLVGLAVQKLTSEYGSAYLHTQTTS